MREILLAYQGRVDELKAIHGGGSDQRAALTPAKDGPGVLAMLRGMGARRKK